MVKTIYKCIITEIYLHFTFVQNDDMDANEDAEQDNNSRFDVCVCVFFL